MGVNVTYSLTFFFFFFCKHFHVENEWKEIIICFFFLPHKKGKHGKNVFFNKQVFDRNGKLLFVCFFFNRVSLFCKTNKTKKNLSSGQRMERYIYIIWPHNTGKPGCRLPELKIICTARQTEHSALCLPLHYCTAQIEVK